MKIYLVPLRFQDNFLLKKLSDNIEKSLTAKVILYRRNIPLIGSFDKLRNQFNSSWLLNQLKIIKPPDADKILGLTEYDLFIPIFTFVFGEAEFNGPTAVISTYRFRNELYGLAPDKNIVASRLITESLHELGHTLGLRHCRETNCVMRPSSYVEEIDFKPAHFCKSCNVNIL